MVRGPIRLLHVLPAQDQTKLTSVQDLLPPRLAAQLERVDILSRKILRGTLPGERRGKRRGRSVEFDDFREYVPGDDPRHVDWNALARLDRLIVKLFREEEDLSLHVVVDMSGSMATGKPSKLIFAARLAAALADVALANQNRVALTAFGAAGASTLAALRGRRSLSRVAEFLIAQAAVRSEERAMGVVGAGFNAAIRAAVGGGSSGGKGRGVVFVISDFAESRAAMGPALNMLGGATLGGRIDAHAVRVVSPSEEDPRVDRGRGLSDAVALTEIETGRMVETAVNDETLAVYRRSREAELKSWAAWCASAGVGGVVVRSDVDIADLVLSTLRRQRVVG